MTFPILPIFIFTFFVYGPTNSVTVTVTMESALIICHSGGVQGIVMSESVTVCLSAQHISKTTQPNFTTFSVQSMLPL